MRFLALAAAALVGCATTDGLAPQVSRSGFDNAKTVTITPHGNACTSMICTGLGAQWNGARPSEAFLTVRITNEIKAITGAQLNIDGKVVTLASSGTVTSFDNASGMKESTQAFPVDLATIRSVTEAKRVWLRVLTPTGYLEDAVIDGTTDSKAYHALKRFLAAVDAG